MSLICRDVWTPLCGTPEARVRCPAQPPTLGFRSDKFIYAWIITAMLQRATSIPMSAPAGLRIMSDRTLLLLVNVRKTDGGWTASEGHERIIDGWRISRPTDKCRHLRSTANNQSAGPSVGVRAIRVETNNRAG